MKHIDKTLCKHEGEQIVSEFLSCFYKRKGAYPQDLYKAFSSEIDDCHGHQIFRQRLISEVLWHEQNGRCCYCLRDLSQCKKTTVEHIMPNHAKDKAELDTYRVRPTVLDGLPHPDAIKGKPFDANPPHPHPIAYQNLILSCDGKLFDDNEIPACCNLKRAHRFMPPFVLYADVQDKFEYSEDGTVAWSDDTESPDSKSNVVRILGLNKSLLKMIRRIWFFCNNNALNPLTDDRHVIINLLFGHLVNKQMTEAEANMLMNFKMDKYWHLLQQYSSFAEITNI